DGPGCLAPQSAVQKLIAPRDCSSPAYDAHALEVAQWLTAATLRYPNAALVDMNDAVCPGERCGAELDGRGVFRDAQHLSVEFAASLAGDLSARLGVHGGG